MIFLPPFSLVNLKVEEAYFSETLVPIYQFTRRHKRVVSDISVQYWAGPQELKMKGQKYESIMKFSAGIAPSVKWLVDN
jgi:hypothetical protein